MLVLIHELHILEAGYFFKEDWHYAFNFKVYLILNKLHCTENARDKIP